MVFAAKLRNEHQRDATRVRQQHSPTKLVSGDAQTKCRPGCWVQNPEAGAKCIGCSANSRPTKQEIYHDTQVSHVR